MSQDIERYAARAEELSEGGKYEWWADLAAILRSQATMTAERDAAWNEAQCCDDTPLGQSSLAEFIADQHACRKAAEALVQSMREALEALPDRTDQPHAEAFAEAVDDWWKETVLPALSRSEV